MFLEAAHLFHFYIVQHKLFLCFLNTVCDDSQRFRIAAALPTSYLSLLPLFQAKIREKAFVHKINCVILPHYYCMSSLHE